MKLRKLLLLGMCLGMICGCSSNDTKKEGTMADSDKKSINLYDGLDAKETYQKASDYFNEQMSYVKRIYVATDDKGEPVTIVCNEMYNENAKRSGVLKSLSKTDLSRFEVFKDEKYYRVFDGERQELSSEKQKEYYNKFQKNFYSRALDSSDDGNISQEIVKIEREDKNKEIVLSMQYTYKLAQKSKDGSKEWSKPTYNMINTYIDENGFIYKEENFTCDENFTNPKKTGTTTYSDFNKKSSFDYDQEVKNIDKYKNMSVEEFKKELDI